MKDLSKLFELDYRSLALYRVLLGCVVLYDLAARAVEVPAFYTDGGVLPRAPLIEQFQSEWNWSLHLLSGAAAVQYVLFALAGASAVAFILGYRTRAAAALSLVLLISLHNRNPLVLSSSDQLMRVLLFWTLFLPVGAAYSLDRARAAPGEESRPSNVSVGTAAFILQVCLVYWFTAALKSDPAWWRDGSALYYAFNIDYLTTGLGRVLLTFPGLLRALSYVAIALEAAGPALLFFPRGNAAVRTVIVFAFILFHLSMTLMLTLGTFPFVCAAMWSSLLPAEFWRRAGERLGGRGAWAARLGPPAVARTPAWMNVAAAVFFGYVLFWNFGPVTSGRMGVPAPAGWVGQVTGLAQSWRMFAPLPKTDDGWYVIPAKLRGGGDEVDLFRDGAPVSWAKPDPVLALYPNSYWQKYTENLWLRDFAGARLYYARYLCRTWNASRGGGDEELRTFRIVYMREDTPPPGRPTPLAEPVTLWEHDCFK